MGLRFRVHPTGTPGLSRSALCDLALVRHRGSDRHMLSADEKARIGMGILGFFALGYGLDICIAFRRARRRTSLVCLVRCSCLTRAGPRTPFCIDMPEAASYVWSDTLRTSTRPSAEGDHM